MEIGAPSWTHWIGHQATVVRDTETKHFFLRCNLTAANAPAQWGVVLRHPP